MSPYETSMFLILRGTEDSQSAQQYEGTLGGLQAKQALGKRAVTCFEQMVGESPALLRTLRQFGAQVSREEYEAMREGLLGSQELRMWKQFMRTVTAEEFGLLASKDAGTYAFVVGDTITQQILEIAERSGDLSLVKKYVGTLEQPVPQPSELLESIFEKHCTPVMLEFLRTRLPRERPLGTASIGYDLQSSTWMPEDLHGELPLVRINITQATHRHHPTYQTLITSAFNGGIEYEREIQQIYRGLSDLLSRNLEALTVSTSWELINTHTAKDRSETRQPLT